MSLIPFKINPDLLQYFYRDFAGQETRYAGKVVKAVSISPNSLLGRIVISQLRRIDYPVKNITGFNLFLEIDYMGSLFWDGDSKLFKKNYGKETFLSLPESAIGEINAMMEVIFRQNFFYYVEGYCISCNGRITQAIHSFMERYKLDDTNYNYEQLRRLYYRMKDDLPGSRLNEAFKPGTPFAEK